MTTKQRVESVEDSNRVEELVVRKFGATFQVYPWLKGRLFHKIITGKESNETKSFKVLFRQIRSVFYGWWNYYRRYDAWAFSTSAERRLIDGKFHDKLFDYLGNNLGKKVLIIENRLFNYYPYRKVSSRYAVSRSLWMLIEEVYGRLILRTVQIDSKELLEEILDTAGTNVDAQDIVKKYLAQYWLMKNWLKIFPNPKVVFMSVAYTSFGYIRAFKERGIEVIEFQHGLITKNHHAYYYLKKFDSIQFPDRIITIGEKERNVFDLENNFPSNNIMPVGSYILDYYSSKNIVKNNTKKRVLFAMQDGVIGEKLIEFVLNLKSMIPDNIELVIQPRRKPIHTYANKFPEVDHLKVSAQDFYSELLTCDIHATVYSTTAIESLSLGKQNILINIDSLAKEQLGSILGNNEFTYFVNTPNEFVELIKGIKTVEESVIMNSNDDNVKSNYKINLDKLMREIQW